MFLFPQLFLIIPTKLFIQELSKSGPECFVVVTESSNQCREYVWLLCLPVSQQLTGCSGMSALLLGRVWYYLHAAECGVLNQEVLSAVEPWPGGRTTCCTPAIHLQAAEKEIDKHTHTHTHT